jgi:hypothetical protein
MAAHWPEVIMWLGRIEIAWVIEQSIRRFQITMINRGPLDTAAGPATRRRNARFNRQFGRVDKTAPSHCDDDH